VVPAANERNLVLRQEVCEAVSQGQFHVYSVQSVDEAIALLASGASPNTLGVEAGTKVCDLVMAQLEAFNEALKERSSPDRWPADSDWTLVCLRTIESERRQLRSASRAKTET
jgi:hypothetical protein